MGLHKLSAGDGSTYLTRQVAAADDTHSGRGRGRGRHPNNRAIVRQIARDSASRRVQDAATTLGHAYHVYEPSAFHARSP
jgi:hypothetical protein